MIAKLLAHTLFAAFVLNPATLFAQNVPAEGSTIKGQLVIGRSTFALPPGEWHVVAVDSTGAVTTDGSRAGSSEVATVRLVQLDVDGTLIASMWHSVPLGTTRAPGSWTDAICGRKDTLFRDDFNVNPNFPECLVINHIVGFFATAPTNNFERRAWDWLEKNSVKRPTTVLTAFYRKYFSGDYVQVNMAVNPEFFGQDPSHIEDWNRNEWNPNVIRNHAKRLAFVENFKQWSYMMAESARTTLTDRRPNSASLTALDQLRVGVSKAQSVDPSRGECVSKKMTFTDGSTACMEQFEPLVMVINEGGRNIADDAQLVRTHSYAILASDSTCLGSSGWSWNGANDDERAIKSCESSANRKSSKSDCRCTSLIPVSGAVAMTQRDFVKTLFNFAYELIEQRRARTLASGLSSDVVKRGLEVKEQMHYDRLAKK